MSAAAGLSPPQRRWWLALAASLVVHLALLSSPGWRLPTLDELLAPSADAPLAARLAVPPPRPAPAAPAAPVPPPAAAPAPQKAASAPRPSLIPVMPAPDAVPSAPTLAPAVPSHAPTEQPAAPAPAVQPAPAADFALPRRLRIRYAIMRGESGFVVGRAEHRWTREGTNYTLRAVAETTGLAALFRPATVVQVSEGEVGADGLRPKLFRVERDGRAGDTASFDRAAGRVAMNPGPRDLPFEPGMQDMLSMFYQAGLLPALADGVGMTVATGKKIERFVFTLVGEEKITTPLGEMAAQHIKTVLTAGGDATEIWVGVERRLPLRIRHVDRKGEAYDQVADELEIE